MKIEEIKVNGQVRKDLGDLTELKQSIKEHGVLQPILMDGKGHIIAGHRRLAASKELGLKEIPTINLVDAKDIPIIQLVENIQRKNLDPIEEGKAYNKYLSENKCSVENLSKKIGKTKDYIQRRVNLKNLIPEISTALQEKKIELGHALLLNQMKKEQQKESLKFIQEYDLTVQNFSDQIRWMTKIDFMDLEYRPCNDGTKQKNLIEQLGSELDPLNETEDYHTMKGGNKFTSELGNYVESQRKILRDKGITVFSSLEELKKKHPEAKQISSWEDSYDKIVKGLPKSKDHAVIVDLSSGGCLDRAVMILEPKKEKEKGKSKTSSVASTKEDKDESDKILEKTRKEKFKTRIHEYKRKHEETINVKLLVKDTKIHKAIQNLFNAHKSGAYSVTLKGLMDETPAKLDKENFDLMKKYISEIGEEDLHSVSESNNLDWSKEWIVDDDFLELHTKNQLIDLIKELGIGIENSGEAWKSLTKKQELKDFILEYDLKGEVPKIMKKK